LEVSNIRLVETQPALQAACTELAAAKRLYLDTEFEPSRAGASLCLVQVSQGDTIYLIDALRLPAQEPLRAALCQGQKEWVLHAASQDVPLLLHWLGLVDPPSLFDTQVAWALLTPEYSVSLAYLNFRVLGVRTAKAHQTDDWRRRPLPSSQLRYAASDIETLPALREELGRRARARTRELIVLAASRDLARPVSETPARLELSSFRNAWQLDPRSQAGLRFIIDWYNGLDPKARAHAPEPKTLLSIANRMPGREADLARIKGVPRRWCSTHGAWFTRELDRASRQATRDDFVAIEPPPYATFEEIRLEAWLQMIRAELCTRLELAPEMALPGRIMRRGLRAIAYSGNPAALLEQLGDWRRQLLEKAYTDAVQRLPAPLE
jgi:ribonuclease D